MIRASVLLLILFLLACGTDRSDNPARGGNHVLEMTLEDTIGVDTGDQRYVFGDICNLSIDSNGNLLVLDAITCKVRRYTLEGEYLGEFAGFGSGPGEIMDPMAMTVLSGGGVAIGDWEAWGIFFYDSSFAYTGFSGVMEGGSPLSLTAGPDNSVTGLGVRFWSENDQPVGEYFLASWKDSVNETFRFMEGPASVEPLPIGDVVVHLPVVFFDSSPEHDLYAALSTDSTYSIHRFSSSGEELGVLEQHWDRIPLNTASREEIYLEALHEGEGISEDVPYANAIQGINCDDTGKLWVRLGTAPHPVFNVYNSEGEHIAVVEATALSDPLFELSFRISGGRVFSWNTNPADYPKIIILTNPLYSKSAEI